jgi:hypothetical protein
MHVLVEAEMLGVERDRGVDVVDDVANADGCHVGISPCSLCVELRVALIDLNDGSVRRLDSKGAAPLVVNDRALGRESGRE